MEEEEESSLRDQPLGRYDESYDNYLKYCDIFSKAPWMTSNYDKANMKNTFKFAGSSLTKGKFFSGGTSFVVGAPKANNYRGAVYVCKDCFGRNKFASGHMTVEGIQMGEGFGTSAAACDINGDGFDDLIVGAPTFSSGRSSKNMGRVHVFINAARKLSK